MRSWQRRTLTSCGTDCSRTSIRTSGRLKRRFVLLKADKKPRWDRGGRLFGDGFWINLESSRRSGIRIDGEPVADLDYSSMFARLAYAHVGAVAPSGDLYAISGLEGYRSGVKLAFNVFLFDGKGLRKAWPKARWGSASERMQMRRRDPREGSLRRPLAGRVENPQRLRKAILKSIRRWRRLLEDASGTA